MKKVLAYILIIIHLSIVGNFLSIVNIFAFAPFNASLIQHYDAQDMNADGNISIGEPINGSSVSSWLDASNSFTGSQLITAGQPIYQTGAINNSLPGVTFDGTSDILEIQDEIQINLDETFLTKSFALVIETGTDITTTQTIYEQWTHQKWYGFQISWGNLYGWIWNSLDWTAWDQYKIINYWPISTNTSYYITLVHDNTDVIGYLDGIFASTQTNANTQTIHGICKFDTFFGCSLYGTGGTIGIGATQNDTLNLATQGEINNTYQWNYFSGSIWEIIAWDIALSPAQVTIIDDYFKNRWEPDNIAPTITWFSPMSNSLLPIGNFSVNMYYSDDVWGSGINSSSWEIVLQKWNSVWATYWPDISSSYLASSSITTWTGTFDYTAVPYGKYRATFQIADIAGNSTNQSVEFYIDEIEMIVSTGSLDMWNIDSFSSYFSDELVVTVRTVWAAHDVFLKKNTDLSYLTESINQFGLVWYGYEQWPTYSNTITDFASSTSIWSSSASLNTDGEKNTYTYRIKIGALIDIQQAAWDYEWSIDIGIEIDY